MSAYKIRANTIYDRCLPNPYPNRNQAVSGTLSFAIGCGRAIVSTPYDYSLELLANNRGLVASKADPNELAALIDSILSSPN